MTVVAVPPNAVDAVKPRLEPLIERALEHGSGEIGADRMLAMIEAQTALGLLIVDEDAASLASFEDAIQALCIAQLTSQELHDQKRITLHVATLAGDGLEEWLETELLPALEKLAREQGASALTMRGRRGWKRVLARVGWSETDCPCGCDSVVMVRSL